MDSTFLQACEACRRAIGRARAAVGRSCRTGASRSVAVGCEPDDPLPDRLDHEAVHRALRAVQLLDLERSTGVWPDDVRVRHLLSHTSGFDCELGDLARFGDGDDALGRAVAELPAVRRSWRRGELFSYANTGYWLAGRLLADAAGTTYEEAVARARPATRAGCRPRASTSRRLPGTGPDGAPSSVPACAQALGRPRLHVPPTCSAFGGWQLAAPGPRPARLARRCRRARSTARLRRRAGRRTSRSGGTAAPTAASSRQLLLVPGRGAVFAGLTNSGRGRPALREHRGRLVRAAARRPAAVRPALELGARRARTRSPASTRTRVERAPSRPAAAGSIVEFGERRAAGRGDSRGLSAPSDVRDRRRRLRPRRVRLSPPRPRPLRKPARAAARRVSRHPCPGRYGARASRRRRGRSARRARPRSRTPARRAAAPELEHEPFAVEVALASRAGRPRSAARSRRSAG